MLIPEASPNPEQSKAPGHLLFDATTQTQQLEYDLLEKVFGLDTLLEDAERTNVARRAVMDLSPEELATYLNQEDELNGRIVQDAEFAKFLSEEPGYKIFTARRDLTRLAIAATDKDGLHGFGIVQIDPGEIRFSRHIPRDTEVLGQPVQVEAMQTITLQAEDESVKTAKKTVYFSPWLDMPTPIEDKDNPPTEDIDVRVAVDKIRQVNVFLEDLKHKDTDELRAEVEQHLLS